MGLLTPPLLPRLQLVQHDDAPGWAGRHPWGPHICDHTMSLRLKSTPTSGDMGSGMPIALPRPGSWAEEVPGEASQSYQGLHGAIREAVLLCFLPEGEQPQMALSLKPFHGDIESKRGLAGKLHMWCNLGQTWVPRPEPQWSPSPSGHGQQVRPHWGVSGQRQDATGLVVSSGAQGGHKCSSGNLAEKQRHHAKRDVQRQGDGIKHWGRRLGNGPQRGNWLNQPHTGHP